MTVISYAQHTQGNPGLGVHNFFLSKSYMKFLEIYAHFQKNILNDFKSTHFYVIFQKCPKGISSADFRILNGNKNLHPMVDTDLNCFCEIVNL